MAHLLPMSPALAMASLRTSPARHLTCGLAALATIASIELPAKVARSETAVPNPIESPAPSRTLTLPEALSYAHAHQPAIRAALSRVRERIEQAKIPSGRWLPTVAVTAELYGATANNTTGNYVDPSYMDLPRIGATPATATGSLRPYPSTLAAAGVTQEIFDFGRIAAQRAAGDALADVESHAADAVRLDVDFGVEEAFFSVLAAKSVVTASDEAYQRALVHRDLARAGVGSGLRSPIELTRAEADLARFDVGRIRSRGGLAVAQAVFAAAIGAPDPAVDVGSEAPRPAEMPTLAEAIERAGAHDPVLLGALSQLRASEARTRAVGAELRPNLVGTGTFSGRAGGAQPSNNAAVPSGEGWVPGVPNWDLGLVLSWPLFDGTIAARRDAARAQEQVYRDEIDVAHEQEIARVRQSFVAVQIARSALVALEREAVAARANYDQADARYRSGMGNAVELADAEAVRTEADIQLALGQFELARSRAAFGRAIAEGL